MHRVHLYLSLSLSLTLSLSLLCVVDWDPGVGVGEAGVSNASKNANDTIDTCYNSLQPETLCMTECHITHNPTSKEGEKKGVGKETI